MQGLLGDVNVQGHMLYLQKRLLPMLDLWSVLVDLDIRFVTFHDLGIPRHRRPDPLEPVSDTKRAGSYSRKTGTRMDLTRSSRHYSTPGGKATFLFLRLPIKPDSIATATMPRELQGILRACSSISQATSIATNLASGCQ